MFETNTTQSVSNHYFVDVNIKKIPDGNTVSEVLLLHANIFCPLAEDGVEDIGSFQSPNIALTNLKHERSLLAHLCPHCFQNLAKIQPNYKVLNKIKDEFFKENSLQSATHYYIEKKLTPNTNYNLLSKIYTQQGAEAWKKQVSRDGISHVIHKVGCDEITENSCYDLGYKKKHWDAIKDGYAIYNLDINDYRKGVRLCPKCCKNELDEIKFK